MRRLNWKVLLLALALAIALRAFAHAQPNVTCDNVSDVGPQVQALVNAHQVVEFPPYNGLMPTKLHVWTGSTGTNACVLKTSIDLSADVKPGGAYNGSIHDGQVIRGNGAVLITQTGDAAAWDLTGTEGVVFDPAPYMIGAATNASTVQILSEPTSSCESLIGSIVSTGGYLCATPQCGSHAAGFTGIIIAGTEQNVLINPVFAQGDNALWIYGQGAQIAPPIKSLYSTQCNWGYHTAIGNTLIGGSYAGNNGPSIRTDGGVQTFTALGTWLGQPGGGTPGTHVAAISGTTTQEEWSLVLRVEEWPFVLEGIPHLSANSSVIAGVPTYSSPPPAGAVPVCPANKPTLTPSTARCL